MEDVSEKWGMNELTFTNGTVIADFDNDGDLDIALNNLDQEAALYENKSNGRNRHDRNGFIQLKFSKSVSDMEKIGLKATLYQSGKQQYIEYNPFRGYKSTVGEILHFGIGNDAKADSILVKWPDGRMGRYYNINRDTVIYLSNTNELEITSTIQPKLGIEN